jgi:hypothetical protein
MNWNTIRLELARSENFPTGSVSRGYLVRVPLKADGSIDEDALQRAPRRATVRRFWSTEPDESGRVARIDGRWGLRCNGSGDRLLSTDHFASGDQVILVEPGGVSVPFRVANIRRLG